MKIALDKDADALLRVWQDKRHCCFLTGRCREYIKDIVAPIASNPGRQQLQSAARSDVIVPRRTKFGRRAFSIAGPEVWNCLPQSVRSADTVRQFRRLLKTHYFQLHFSPN